MPTRSYNNAFEVVDYTAGLQFLTHLLMGDLGLFSVENLTGRTVTFEEKDGVLNLLTDRHRGEKPQTLNSGERVIRSYPVAHFPWTDTVRPGDVAGKRAYGTDAVETIEAKMVEKSIAASKAMDLTLEAARMSTIVRVDAFIHIESGFGREECNSGISGYAGHRADPVTGFAKEVLQWC